MTVICVNSHVSRVWCKRNPRFCAWFDACVYHLQMSLTATSSVDDVATTVSLIAVNFLGSGSISTFEPRAPVEVRRGEQVYYDLHRIFYMREDSAHLVLLVLLLLLLLWAGRRTLTTNPPLHLEHDVLGMYVPRLETRPSELTCE